MTRYYGTESAEEYIEGSWEAVKHAKSLIEAIEMGESGLPALQAHFDSYHTWKWVSGLVALLQDRANKTTCCTEWARELHVPAPDVLATIIQDAQEAYVQGMIYDIAGATTDEMGYWYAEVITNRERDDIGMIEGIQSGQIPLTTSEKEGIAQAEDWKARVIAGGLSRQSALTEAGINPTTGDLDPNWKENVGQELMSVRADLTSVHQTKADIRPIWERVEVNRASTGRGLGSFMLPTEASSGKEWTHIPTPYRLALVAVLGGAGYYLYKKHSNKDEQGE